MSRILVVDLCSSPDLRLLERMNFDLDKWRIFAWRPDAAAQFQINMKIEDATLEPRFIIRGQDRLAVRVVRYYQELAFREGLYEHAEEVGIAVAEIQQWQAENRELVKTPFHKHRPGGD